MLTLLENIFTSSLIENPQGKMVSLHSHTSRGQGIFLQGIFDQVKPKKTLEIGMAFGISSLFILEKHREYDHPNKSHIIIEPYPWKGIAEYNFAKAGLFELTDIYYKKSYEILPGLVAENIRIQYAYVDTIKLFDNVMQDIFFIDKMLDVGGVIILDDCGGSWPGIQKAARFLNSLPHYEFLGGYRKSPLTLKRKIALAVTTFAINLVPFKNRFLPGFNLKTNRSLDLEYRCIAFKKKLEDTRSWDWDISF
ncbi:MAG: class I SAM-dependent methyltransferase [Bacteroidota bacterium]|nr:class I SAM-dependent methyltransferase [Bacteroidota bacterium]